MKFLDFRGNVMKRIVQFVVGVLIAVAILPVVTVSASQEEVDEIPAEAVYSIDYDTKKVLASKNADDSQMGIASLTKLMLMYIVMDAVANGEWSLSDEIVVSDYAADISSDYTLSNVALRAGESYTLEELFASVAIYSANGSAIAIAEAFAGSEAAFVDQIHALLESFGITEYHIVNVTGLNNDYVPEAERYPGSGADDENTMSAHDMLVVSDKLVTDYPEVLEYSSVPTATFREGTIDETHMINFNLMLEGLIYERPGVSGLKTGTTELSGANLVVTAEENGRRVVSIVMHAGDGLIDTATRYEAMNQLLDYSFDNYENVELTAENFSSVSTQPVSNGQQDTVALEPAESMVLTLPTTAEENAFTVEFAPEEGTTSEEGALHAPITAGNKVGRFLAQTNDKLGYLYEDSGNHSVDAVAAETVEELNIFARAWNGISDFFVNVWNSLFGSIVFAN